MSDYSIRACFLSRIVFILIAIPFFQFFAYAQLHFASIGSWGSGSLSQYSVCKTLKSTSIKKKFSFLISPGSNFIDGVESLEDDAWETKFRSPFLGPSFNLPFFTVLGAGDWSGNYTAEILRTNYTYQSGPEEFNTSLPVWTQPNFWYYYSHHFSDASDSTAAQGSIDASIGFIFVDTYILSSKFPHENITSLHWQETRDTLSGFSRIFDWVVVVGDRALLSSGQSKGDFYLSSTLRELLKEFNVDAYISGNDPDMEIIKDDNLLHINCGTGSSSDFLGRIQSNSSVHYYSKIGFCDHVVTKKEFTTSFIDGFSGKTLANYTKKRNQRARRLFDRYRIYNTLPEIRYYPIPEWKQQHLEPDLFVRVVGSIGLTVLAFIIGTEVVSVGHKAAS